MTDLEQKQYAKEMFGRGIRCLRAKNFSDALEFFEECLFYDHRIIDSHFYLARIRYEFNDFLGAIHDYSIVLDAQKENAGAYNNRAIAKVALGEFTDALDDYNMAIELDSRDHIYYSNRGLVWLNLDSPNNALADFNRSLELEPKYAKAYLFRGNIQEKYYNFHNAMNDFSKAIENAPSFYDAFLRRGKIQVYFGDIEYGMNNLQYGAEFISYAFWHKENRKNEGLFKDYPFYYDRAISDFSKAIELKPHNYEGYIHRASCNLKISLYFGIESGPHKLHKQARKDALKAVERSEGAAGFYALASAEARLGHVDLALKHLEQALDYGEQNLDAIFRDKSWEDLLDDLTFSAIIENFKAEEELFEDFGFDEEI